MLYKLRACEGGGTGRRARFRIWWGFPCGFESRPSHLIIMINSLIFLVLSALPTVGIETAITVPINGYNLLYGSSLSVNTYLPLKIPVEPFLSLDLGSIKGDHDYSIRMFGAGLGLLTRISKIKFGFQALSSRIERKFGEGSDSDMVFGTRGIVSLYPLKIGNFAGFVNVKVTTYSGKKSNLLVTSAGIGLEYTGL